MIDRSIACNYFKQTRGELKLKEFHVTVDFNDDVQFTTFRKENLDQMMQYFYEIGIRRVYWIYFGGKKEDLFWRDNGATKWFNREQKIKILGDPLSMAVKYAHKHDLEIYGYIKPYDWGLSWTYPEGSPLADRYGTIRRIGGRMPRVTRFLREHPDMRIRRKMLGIPDDVNSKTITKIRLVKLDDKPTRIGRDNIQIWISDDNYKYQPYAKGFDFADQVEKRSNDTAGNCEKRLPATNSQVRVLTLGGLDIPEKYVVVTTNFQKGEPDFINIAKALVEVYSNSQQLPISVATGYAVWSHLHGLQEARRTRDFRTEGLEFDQGRGTRALVLDTDNRPLSIDRYRRDPLDKSGFIGIAGGKNEYLAGTPCEAYPEVRRFWLRLVRECIKRGVDGIDISHRSHGAATDDPNEYGFNEPIVREYERLYGKNILRESFDEDKLAELRGKYYDSFLREAKKEMSKTGLNMQIHVNLDYGANRKPAHLRHVKLNWEKWINEGLADEITLRSHQPPKVVLRNSLTDKVLDLAERNGKKVFYNQYINWIAVSRDSGKPLNEETGMVFGDERIDGFILYESASFTRVIDGRFIGSEDIKYALKQYIS